MRSKAKAHRVPCVENDSGAQVIAGDRSYNRTEEIPHRPFLDREPSSSHNEDKMVVPQHHPQSNETPVYIPEDISIPSTFYLKESQTFDGLGIWTKLPVEKGQRFGPFAGTMREVCEDASSAWEIVDSRGEVKAWIDASEPGSGNWLKYVRSCSNVSQRNVMAVQSKDEIFYKTTKDIEVGCELLLFNDDAVISDNCKEVCGHCKQEFTSANNLRHHQMFSCLQTAAHFANKQNRQENADASLSPKHSSGSEGDESDSNDIYEKNAAMMNWVAESSIPLMTTDEDGERVFNCENCDKVFTDPSNLQRHIRSTHVGARCHACPECGKTFATSSGLKQHQHIHSSVKPFQCEVCMKAYTQFSNLCRHKRMHADCRQQIKCKDCGQAFSTVTSLSKHQRFCDEGSRSAMRPTYPPHNFPVGLKPVVNRTPSVTPSGSPSPNNSTARDSPQISPIRDAFMSNLYGRAPAGFPLYPHAAPTLPGGFPFVGAAAHGNQILQNLLASYMQMQQQGQKLPPIVPNIPMPNLIKNEMEIREKRKAAAAGLLNESPPEKVTKREHTVVKPEPIRAPKPIMKHSNSQPNLATSASKVPQAMSPVGKPPQIKDVKPPTSSTNQQVDNSSPTQMGDKKKPGKDFQPLDLSNKLKSENESPDLMKKFMLEQKSASAGDLKKLPHHAFPFVDEPAMINAMMMNPALRDKMIQDAAKVMSTLLPPGLPFPPLFPPMIPNMAATPTSADIQQKISQPPLTPQSSSPLMSTAGKSEAHFNFNATSNTKAQHKEKYACKYCGKVFPRSANLTRHLRTHTGEQPYKCKYCERSFSISSNLQRHVRNIHNKEKPFKCHICERCFGQQTNLDRHLMKHELNSNVSVVEELNESVAYPEPTVSGSGSSDGGEASFSSSPLAV